MTKEQPIEIREPLVSDDFGLPERRIHDDRKDRSKPPFPPESRRIRRIRKKLGMRGITGAFEP